MKGLEYISILVEVIHSTTIATIGADGHPQTRVIDMMLYDDNGVYFLTAKGKVFYEQLMEQQFIAVSATKDKMAVSLRGKVRNIGYEKLDEIFEKNAYMQKIYPDDTRTALQVFQLYEAQGEFFDISNPSNILRESIVIGETAEIKTGYYVGKDCIGCKLCYSVCPQKCIDISKKPVEINRNHCLHCGRCAEICPKQTIKKVGEELNQRERRTFLIENLLKEQPRYAKMQIPSEENEQRTLLRSLMNIRMPGFISEDFLQIQDEYFAEIRKEKGMITLSDMEEVKPGIYIWQGDITRLEVGAIVNAANSGMTGCYQPCHNCIDNCIHTYAGIQLRNKCAEIMDAQEYEESTGQAKITPAYNLPCDYVIHTVGPIVQGGLTKEHERLLESCYRSCLTIADENGVSSIAFCCISTGVFMFPNERAAKIAVETVSKYKEEKNSGIKVIFNVFKDEDAAIYHRLLR